MNDSDIRNKLTKDIGEELDIYMPKYYGLPDELYENEEFKQAWWSLQMDFIEQTVDRLFSTSDLLVPDTEEWFSLVREASNDFLAHVTTVERMSLTVPAYVPYLVRQLAEGPRQMGEAVTKLVVAAFLKEPEPQGILERIESKLYAMESHMQVLDRAVQANV